MEGILALLIPFAFFGLIFGIYYVHYTIRNRERMAMIEKGVDASFFETKKGGKRNYGSLIFKIGMFFIGIGLGIVAAYALVYGAGMEEGAAYPSMIFLLGGLALVVVYLLERKHEKEDNE